MKVSLNSNQRFQRRGLLKKKLKKYKICHNFQTICKIKIPFCIVCSPSPKDASVKVSLNSNQRFQRRGLLKKKLKKYKICHNFQTICKIKIPFCIVCSPSPKDASVKVSLNSNQWSWRRCLLKKMLTTHDTRRRTTDAGLSQ